MDIARRVAGNTSVDMSRLEPYERMQGLTEDQKDTIRKSFTAIERRRVKELLKLKRSIIAAENCGDWQRKARNPLYSTNTFPEAAYWPLTVIGGVTLIDLGYVALMALLTSTGA